MAKTPPSDFRETLYTIDKRGNRRWVYSSLTVGRWFQRRALVAYALMAIYLLAPWITVGGEQAVRFDLMNSRLVAFGQVFWATDTQFLVLILILLALSLFFFTALFGRVWCGWACPETVFLEFVYRPIERLIEGSATQRLQLDSAPWNGRKILIKGTKYIVFCALAWVLASTALAYFIGREPLLRMMAGSPLHNLTPFLLTLALMGVMLFQFGWFREQFCTIVCPYARFQSVLMDSHSLSIGYDRNRGEPRGKLKRGDAERVQGDCIDCGLCQRVCPTGIDIRNGLQLECIACAACVDACDSIMDSIGRSRGLIRYDTELGLSGARSRFLRPRVIAYALVLAAILTTLSLLLSSRVLLEAFITRGAADVPYARVDDSTISNHLNAKVANKGNAIEQVHIELRDAPDVKLVVPANPFPVRGNTVQEVPLFFQVPVSTLRAGKRRVQVRFYNNSGFDLTQEVVLLGPDAPGEE